MANFAGRMKQKRSFIWLWIALLAVCLTVLQNWQEQKTVYSQSLPERAESSVITPQQHHHHEATLTDASQLYRVCSSRPQRILPSQGSKTERTITPLGSFALRQHIVKQLNFFYDSRCRQETAPFCMSASCDYYVIALRHIIR
ncbi:hypothetical protein M1D30_11100 [Prevotella sp. E15-22]|uniref:hypothetical protein n=1 Tax=Prevotella sp. E15-22 TaxID=2937774 RepID=UPI00206CD76B|nr:hypothetical protein [Prevotella sp. E15-22]UPS44107.1 hypothetical protein M1D30_11100 [Prevotella sp. E15-22]